MKWSTVIRANWKKNRFDIVCQSGGYQGSSKRLKITKKEDFDSWKMKLLEISMRRASLSYSLKASLRDEYPINRAGLERELGLSIACLGATKQQRAPSTPKQRGREQLHASNGVGSCLLERSER